MRQMRDGIREDILNCLQKHPADFNNLLEMMNDKGYEIKRGKHTAQSVEKSRNGSSGSCLWEKNSQKEI